MFAFGTQTVGPFNFSVDQATLVLRFVFVIIGLLIAFAVYLVTRQNAAWEVGTRRSGVDGHRRRVVRCVLLAVQRHRLCCAVTEPGFAPAGHRHPMFFGYAFGPVVGFFTGAVGNMFGDALTGFGLSPQWSIGNGLVGFVAGMSMLFKDKKKSMDTVLWVGGALAVLTRRPVSS